MGTIAKRTAAKRVPKGHSKAYHVSTVEAASVFSATTPEEVSVDTSNCLTFSAVWAAVRCISETVASLPCFVYLRDGEQKTRTTIHPLYQLLHDAPNPEMTAFTFWETLTQHLLIFGNAYAQIVRTNAGQVAGLGLLLPGSMNVKRVENKAIPQLNLIDPRNSVDPEGTTLIYEYTYAKGTAYLFPWDVLHIPALSSDGILGLSPIQYAKRAIELGISAEQFGKLYYEKGACPPYAIIHPQVLGPEGVAYLQKYIQERGVKRQPPVLEEGIKIEQFRLDADTTQFLESRRFSVNQIAGFFRIAPYKIGGDGPSNTYSNIEAANRSFLQESIAPWLERIEQEVNRKLFAGTDYFAEFCADAYLRADQATRYASYALGFGKWIFEDDIRIKESMPLRTPEEKAASMPQPQPQPQAQASDQAEAGQQDQQAEKAINAVLPVATEALRRMGTKESNALARIVAKGDRQKLAEFYADHRDSLYSALQPAFVSLCVLLDKSPAEADSFLSSACEQLCAKSLLDCADLSKAEAAIKSRQQAVETTAEEIINQAYRALKGDN
jgi:HK97 family phage portal protein